MAVQNKARVSKRKLDPSSLAKENKASKANKLEKESKGKIEAPKKVSLTMQLQSLQEKYDALVYENKKNIEVIDQLEEKVARLDNERSNTKVIESKECQTEPDYDELACGVCIFGASCEDELRYHMISDHNIGEPDYETNFLCNVCGKRFVAKIEFMEHRKKQHPHTIKLCRYFLQGSCAFEAETCWYSHKINNENRMKPLTHYTCSLCKKDFKSKPEFMTHRKQNHNDIVKRCQNERTDTCTFGHKMCWYNHLENVSTQFYDNDNEESSEMTQRIFQMMEKFTERMEYLENQL